MSLADEYEKLLNYLDSEKKPDKSKKLASTNTKLVEANSIEEYKNISTLSYQKKDIGSNGFNVIEFESLMRAKLIEDFKKSQGYKRPYVSCGELLKCLRQSYYIRNKYELNENDQFKFPYLYLINKVGNEVHNVIQSIYNFDEVEKTIISEKYKVKGRIDAISGNYVCEIKTHDTNKIKNKIDPDHYNQGNIYSYILNTEFNYKINKVVIIYVARDLKTIKAIEKNVDFKIAEQLLDRSAILLSALKTNKIVDPIGSTEEQCKYCDYKKYCKKDKYLKVIQPFNKKQESKKEDSDKTAFLL